MNFLSHFTDLLSDSRVVANVIAVHAAVVAVVLACIVLRKLLTHGGNRLIQWTGIERLGAMSKEATRHGHTLLFWITAATIPLIIAAGVAYHLLGRDIRVDLETWYQRFTVEELFQIGLMVGELAGLVLAAAVTIRVVRRLLPYLENHARIWIGRKGNEETLQHWFKLFDRFVIASIRLAALWGAGHAVGVGRLADHVIGFLLRVLAILALGRLLILASRAITHTLADQGDRHLNKGVLQQYWERFKRLFPFGQHCFEAAVYVSAASLCVRELHFLPYVADFGPRVVKCIGIFFLTRVLIELLQVVLNEAFKMYVEEGKVDQKGRTLVPLIHSVCQYVLYFGSVVFMLGVLGVDTTPILAGAGILGLGVGLGAQSLVTDVVSGFFILFEGQYLVGDYVSIGDAKGTVEAVGIRTTQIRDGQGKLFIIPNGQIKAVVNYSKGYVNAVVDLRVPTGTDLEGIFRAMTEAGRRMKQMYKEVLADTEIHGIVELGTSEMTVRAVTKVEAGTHGMMQSAYRRLLKQVMDQQQATSRPALAA